MNMKKLALGLALLCVVGTQDAGAIWPLGGGHEVKKSATAPIDMLKKQPDQKSISNDARKMIKEGSLPDVYGYFELAIYNLHNEGYDSYHKSVFQQLFKRLKGQKPQNYGEHDLGYILHELGKQYPLGHFENSYALFSDLAPDLLQNPEFYGFANRKDFEEKTGIKPPRTYSQLFVSLITLGYC